MPEDNINMIEQVDLREHHDEPVVRAEEIDRRREYLMWRGFSPEVIDNIEGTRPTLYDPNVIEEHLNWLAEHEFQDPVKLITTLPAIFGYNRESMGRRFRLIGRLIKLYQLPISLQECMQFGTFMFSSKIDKLITLVRILGDYRVDPEQITRGLVSNLAISNLEDTLVAFSQKEGGETIDALTKRIRYIGQQNLSKEEKREIIRKELEEFDKVKRRYLRGYPD